MYVKELTQQQSQYSVNNNDPELFYMAEITDGVYEFQAVPDSTAPWWVTLNVCGSRVKFKIDPGADVTVISTDEYKRLTDKPQLQPTTAQLTGVSAPIKYHGLVHVEIVYKTTRYRVRVYVADVTNNLLGRGAAQQMNLVKMNLSEVLQPFSKLKGPLTHITLQEDSTPYSVRAPRRVPFPLMQPLKEMLEKMEAMDIIVKQTEPTDWCGPIVVATKKTSGIRVCVDLKPLCKARAVRHTNVRRHRDENERLQGIQWLSSTPIGRGKFTTDNIHNAIRTFPVLSPAIQHHQCERNLPATYERAARRTRRHGSDARRHHRWSESRGT